jgi:hypothetical protein
MTARLLTLFAALLPLAVPIAARAQLWSPSAGVSVCGPDCVGYEAHVIPDGEGGTFVAWTESRDYPLTDDDAYLQRITASGEVAPGWPQGGVPLCRLPRTQHTSAISADGEGGVFVAWYDDRSVGPTFGTGFDVYVQRVRGDGTVAPGWPENGATATMALSSQFPGAVTPDGSGGVYVVWQDARDYASNSFDVYAQHLTATGAVAEGWPADGSPGCTAPEAQFNLRALADGAGGVIIVWDDCRDCYASPPSEGTYGMGLLPNGSIASGWSVNGSLLAAGRALPLIASDDAGGFYVASATPGDFYFAELWAQRFRFDGTPAPGWPAEGFPVSRASGDRYPHAVAPDQLGGLLWIWSDHRGPGPSVVFASRVTPGGAIAPGWPQDGIAVSQILGGQSEGSDIVADGLGGAYLCWEWDDYSTPGTQTMVQHLTAQGTVAAGWPSNGLPAATSTSQYRPLAVADGVGGVIVVWEEAEPRPRSGLFAQRFAPNAPTPILVALANVDVTPERVRLTWDGPGAGSLVARVERRGTTSEWERLGEPVFEGSDRLRYEDRSVLPGARYGYRLTYLEGASERFTSETWVEVPAAVRFALGGMIPNPSRGNPTIAFSLDRDEPASLALFDVRGRRVYEREVDSLGPGAHRIAIEGQGTFPAGIYSVRLRQADRVATTRGVIIR